jgi:hypothetical protein
VGESDVRSGDGFVNGHPLLSWVEVVLILVGFCLIFWLVEIRIEAAENRLSGSQSRRKADVDVIPVDPFYVPLRAVRPVLFDQSADETLWKTSCSSCKWSSVVESDTRPPEYPCVSLRLSRDGLPGWPSLYVPSPGWYRCGGTVTAEFLAQLDRSSLDRGIVGA